MIITVAAAICPHSTDSYEIKPRVPTVEGYVSLDPKINPKMKLFHAKIKARTAVDAKPGLTRGSAILVKTPHHE